MSLLLFALYALLATGNLGRGWGADFAQAVIANLEVVFITYPLVYWTLWSRGLSRDQQLTESVVAAIARELKPVPEIKAFASHPKDVEWDAALERANRIELVGRFFNKWATERQAALEDFFRRGGELVAYMIDPEVETAVRAAAADHYGDATADHQAAIRHNITQGAAKIVGSCVASGNVPAQVIRLYGMPRTVNQALIRLAAAEGDQVVLYSYDSFRRDRTRSPAFVMSASAAPSVDELWTNELRGAAEAARHMETDAFER